SALFNDMPLEPAPAFPPAPAILDDTELNVLDNFFTTMNSSPLDGNDFWFNFNDASVDKAPGSNNNGPAGTSQPGNQNNNRGLMAGFDWTDSIPQSFGGLSAALPSPPSFQGQTQTQQHHFMSPPHSRQPLGSNDVPMASMLYDGDGMPEFSSAAYGAQSRISQPLDIPPSKRPRIEFGNTTAASTITPPPSAITTSPRYSGGGIQDIYFTTLAASNAAFGELTSDKKAAVDRAPLRWGSDVSFSHPRYAAPPDQPTTDDRTRALLKHLECLEKTQSLANTRAASPVGLGHRQFDDAGRTERRASSSNAMQNLSLSDQFAQPSAQPITQSHDAQSKRRRRSTKRGFVDEQEQTSPEQVPSNGHRASVAAAKTTMPKPASTKHSLSAEKVTTPSGTAKARAASASSSSSATRHRNSAAAAKAARENLSEEQKRANHILSEQKRRDMIKKGFEDLCTLVPELHGGGFSKSMMLMQAADWLEELLRGNMLLKERLLSMGGH
ncbi:hypothetical protein KEM55_005728, partial [Ascosphaera atra]